MKKIINGKAYDTEKAKQVAYWENWGSWRDFEHIEETLYQKRTGEFFLFGEGGPKTKYAESEGQNCWTGGSKIIPLSWDAARKWAEEHLDADKYAEIFEVEEDDEKTILSISISSAVAERARLEAAKAGISLSDYIASKL